MVRRRKVVAKDIYREYRDINSFLRFLDDKTAKTKGSLWNSSSTSDPEWYGSTSYEEARERCLRGDDNLAKQLRGTEKLNINVPCTGTRRKVFAAVAGFAPHVPNYLAGVPNNMLFCKEEKIHKKVINVYYGCNTLADITAEEIAQVSARVLSCIMSLERKGYRINLYAANCAKHNGQKVGFCVKVKDSGQHIDVLKIAFPFLSAAWNRRFAFRFRETVAHWHRSMGGSVYGDTLRQFLTENKVNYDVALSYYDAKNISSVEELEKLFVKSSNNLNK